MNLDNIKAIVNSERMDWESLLLKEIAKDENAIPIVLAILDDERAEKNQLIIDLNFQLSRAHMTIEHPEMNKDKFVSAEIKAFYKEGRISHCFANMDK